MEFTALKTMHITTAVFKQALLASFIFVGDYLQLLGVDSYMKSSEVIVERTTCSKNQKLIGNYSSTSYIGMTRKKMAANRNGIGPTMLKRACNSTTNTRTKYLSVAMHKTLCSVWLTFVLRENKTVQNCPIVLKNSSSSYYYFAITHKLHKLQR